MKATSPPPPDTRPIPTTGAMEVDGSHEGVTENAAPDRKGGDQTQVTSSGVRPEMVDAHMEVHNASS